MVAAAAISVGSAVLGAVLCLVVISYYTPRIENAWQGRALLQNQVDTYECDRGRDLVRGALADVAAAVRAEQYLATVSGLPLLVADMQALQLEVLVEAAARNGYNLTTLTQLPSTQQQFVYLYTPNVTVGGSCLPGNSNITVNNVTMTPEQGYRARLWLLLQSRNLSAAAMVQVAVNDDEACLRTQMGADPLCAMPPGGNLSSVLNALQQLATDVGDLGYNTSASLLPRVAAIESELDDAVGNETSVAAAVVALRNDIGTRPIGVSSSNSVWQMLGSPGEQSCGGAAGGTSAWFTICQLANITVDYDFTTAPSLAANIAELRTQVGVDIGDPAIDDFETIRAALAALNATISLDDGSLLNATNAISVFNDRLALVETTIGTPSGNVPPGLSLFELLGNPGDQACGDAAFGTPVWYTVCGLYNMMGTRPASMSSDMTVWGAMGDPDSIPCGSQVTPALPIWNVLCALGVTTVNGIIDTRPILTDQITALQDIVGTPPSQFASTNLGDVWSYAAALGQAVGWDVLGFCTPTECAPGYATVSDVTTAINAQIGVRSATFDTAFGYDGFHSATLWNTAETNCAIMGPCNGQGLPTAPGAQYPWNSLMGAVGCLYTQQNTYFCKGYGN